MCERSGLLGCDTIAVGGNQKRVPVRVCNLTSSPIAVYKRQNIAEFSEAAVVNNQNGIERGKSPDVGRKPWTEVTFGDKLTQVEKTQLERLLKRYRSVFSYEGNEGSAKGMEHTIPLTDDAPVTCRPRKLPTK